MKVTFLRHGQTDFLVEKRLQGTIDEPLNEEGEKQAHDFALKIPHEFDIIFSSPLQRASKTAEIINEQLRLPLEIREELIEVYYGNLDGLLWSEIEAETGISQERLNIDLETDFSRFGGESVEDVRTRLELFLEDLKEGHSKERALVVTHAGIIRTMYALQGYSAVTVPNTPLSLHEFEV